MKRTFKVTKLVYMVSVNSLDLGIFVLSVPGTRDTSNLINSIQSLLHITPAVVDSVTPASLPCKGVHPQDPRRHENGLSCIEIATSISHHRARNLAFSLGHRWALFIEDDGIPQLAIADLPNLISAVERVATCDKPTGIHLFPEQFGILRQRNHEFLDVLSLPDYAVGYILNESALHLAEKLAPTIHLSVADWPKGITAINWFAPTQSFIIHPNLDNYPSQSQIEEQRRFRATHASFAHQFLQYPFFRILVLRSARLLGLTYGKSWIGSEKIRSVALLRKVHN